jgi:hypothetical protein
VPAFSPQSQPDPHSSAERTPSSAKSRSYTREAIGVLIVAVILLIIILARHWHTLAWSAR